MHRNKHKLNRGTVKKTGSLQNVVWCRIFVREEREKDNTTMEHLKLSKLQRPG